MAALSSLCLWAICAAPGCDQPNTDFVLKAKVVEALEDGPLVIQATLSYGGCGPARIFWRWGGDNARVEVPDAWEFRRRPQILTYDGCKVGPLELSPGDQRVEIYRLHERYSGIGYGKMSVTLVWDVRAPGKPGEPGARIAKVSFPLEIDIPPATPERLAALRNRMEEQLRTPDLSREERSSLIIDIICTRHHALAPVAWKIIEFPQKLDWLSELIRFVSECPEQYPDLEARLAQMAAKPGWAGAPDAFSFWSERKQPVAPDAWKTLTEAESVWTRSLTYVIFPKRCAKEWKETLFHDLRDQSQPPPSPQFDRLLADLDSDDFDVRERASARLARLGERVEASLRRSLDGPPSAEVRRRVTEILTRLEKAKQPPDCVRALDYLAADHDPECGELLQVLAEGRPDAWLTQQAKEKLAEWRKDRGPPDK